MGQEEWLHQSPVPPTSPLEAENPGRAAWGAWVCLPVVGEWDITGFLIFFFAHSATQLHQLSMSPLVSKAKGSIPSFFTVWTTVQANFGVGNQLWVRINLGQASHRHSSVKLQTKAWDSLTTLCIKHFFWLSTLLERARFSK